MRATLPFLLLLAGAAQAAEPAGHYHPIDVGMASKTFAIAQERAGTAFQDRQDKLVALAAALRSLEEGLDLLGDRAPEDGRARLVALRRTFEEDRGTLSAFAQQQLDGFDAAFQSAVKRALRNRDAAVCRTQAEPQGPRMRPGFRAPAEEKACPGTDLNSTLAETLDADATLRAELETLLGATWPSVRVDARAVEPVGDGPWIDVARLFRAHTRPALQAIDLADESARLDIQIALEEGVTEEDMPALVAQGRAITAASRAHKAAVADGVLEVVDDLAPKKAGTSVSWCWQPALYGGCDGAELPAETREELVTHRRVARALAEASAYRP